MKIHYACWNGLFADAKRLLERGANPNAKDKRGQTPLHYACQQHHFDIVQLLLEKRSNPNAKDELGETPFYHACIYGGRKDIAKLLLEKGASPNIMNDWGHTPLYEICRYPSAEVYERIELAQLLLDKGANPNIIVAKGFRGSPASPLYWACYFNMTGLFHLLIRHGAKITLVEADAFPNLLIYSSTIKRLQTMLWVRENCPDSSLHVDYLPLDLFRLICKEAVRECNEPLDGPIQSKDVLPDLIYMSGVDEK